MGVSRTMKMFETIIVGCGILGASIAYYLSKKQKDLLVVDKGYFSSGTSGATQAWVWVHTKQPGFYAQTCLDSANMYKDLIRDLDVDFDFITSGGLSLIFDEFQLTNAKRLVETQNQYGIPVQLLDRQEVLKKEPNINPDILAATFFDGESSVFPMKLVWGLVEKAARQGATFSYYNEVLSIDQLDNFKYLVHTLKGSFLAEQVVLATGVWSRKIGQSLGIDIPIDLVKGELMVTEPLPPLIKHIVSGIRQLKNGKLLIGYSKEHDGYNTETNIKTTISTAKQAVKMIPRLKQVRILRNFAGVRPIPKDGLPILGEVPDYDGLYVAVTHSGYTLAPYIGKRMAELLLGYSSPIHPSYHISRFY